MMKSAIKAALTGCSVLAIAVPQIALAQDVPEDAGADRGEIIVTATRDARSKQDVPMSVDVATGEEIQKLNIFDVKDIQQLSPGLELTNTDGRSNRTALRGISFDPDQGTAPAVQIYYNEVPTDAQTVYTAIYDVQQIEVLRGPQGLLRGLSAPAGSITIATRKPQFDAIEGYVQGTVTNRAGYNVQGGVTLPFSDQFSLRVAALVDGNRVNNVQNVTRGDRSRSRTESARITLGWRPSSDFTAYLSYQYLHADNYVYPQVFGPGNTPQFLSLPPGPFIVDPKRSGPAAAVSDFIGVAQEPYRFRNNSHIVNLNAAWDLGPATLSFVGAHQETILDQVRSTDPANAVVDMPTPSRTVSPYNVETAELRLTSNNDDGFGWGVGAFYTNQTGDVKVDQDSNSYFAPFPLSYGVYLPIALHIDIPVRTSTWSFNANASFKSGGFRIEGGIRYSILKANQIATITGSSPGAAAIGVGPFTFAQDGIPPALAKHTDKPITGGVTVSYEFSRDLTAYASYGHSFRAGTAGVAAPVGISPDLILSDSEKTDSFEVGLKGALMDRRLNYTVAAFYQKFDGFLSRFSGVFYNCPNAFGTCFAPPVGTPINNVTDDPLTDGAFDFNYNGDATIKGIEASIDARFTPNWDFGLSMSYVKARYSNALLPCNDFAGTGIPNQTGTPRITGTGNTSFCRSNGRLAAVPDFSLSSNTEVRFPIGNITPFVRALFSYRPTVIDNAGNRFQDRELLNLYVGLRGPDGGWEINAFAKNVFNQMRITGDSGGNARVGPYDSGYHIINTTNPREFGLTGTFKF